MKVAYMLNHDYFDKLFLENLRAYLFFYPQIDSVSINCLLHIELFCVHTRTHTIYKHRTYHFIKICPKHYNIHRNLKYNFNKRQKEMAIDNLA